MDDGDIVSCGVGCWLKGQLAGVTGGQVIVSEKVVCLLWCDTL